MDNGVLARESLLKIREPRLPAIRRNLFTTARSMFPGKLQSAGEGRTPVGCPGPLAAPPSINAPADSVLLRSAPQNRKEMGDGFIFAYTSLSLPGK